LSVFVVVSVCLLENPVGIGVDAVRLAAEALDPFGTDVHWREAKLWAGTLHML